jgi:uncharacterized membrane protein
MIPFIVQIVTTLVARIFRPWRDAVRIGLVALFLFTAVAHFNSMKHDLAAMIPPPLTGNLTLIYITGVLEIAGAIGLLIPRTRRIAAICLIVMLIALFPANVYAAMKGVMIGGRPATPLWLRTPMQLFWIWALWWSAVRGKKGLTTETQRTQRSPL